MSDVDGEIDQLITTFIMQYDQRIKIGNKRNIEATDRTKAAIQSLIAREVVKELESLIKGQYVSDFTKKIQARANELKSIGGDDE